jgi:hypothetical protein
MIPEDEGTKIFRNVGNYAKKATASESYSNTAVWTADYEKNGKGKGGGGAGGDHQDIRTVEA